LRDKKDKPLKTNAFKGYVVDKVIEISNLNLVKDIAEVVEYMNPKE